MFRLDGAVALITGASGGIGEAIASTLFACGARVVLSGRRAERLDALAQALGQGAFACPADLRDPGAPDSLVAAVEKLAGPLAILVNNAGLARDQLALRMSEESWREVIEVDLSAPFRLARAALKGMVRRRSGRIITIGSLSGITGNPGQANYAAAKAGVIGMSKTLALEVASRGVTVNVVAPGFIATPMTANLSEGYRAKLIERIPLGRFGTPKDVAAAVAYLASPEAAWVTGTTLHVNGGMAMP